MRQRTRSYIGNRAFRAWLGIVPRDHRKLLVVDEKMGITGGVGVGREWTTGVHKEQRSRWRDTAVLIEGPAARDMIQAFETMWRRCCSKVWTKKGMRTKS